MIYLSVVFFVSLLWWLVIFIKICLNFHWQFSNPLPPSLNENGSNSNEARITACNTQNSKNKKTSNKLAFIIGDSMVKNVEYLIKGSLNRKFFVRPFSSAKTSDMSDYINPQREIEKFTSK